MPVSGSSTSTRRSGMPSDTLRANRFSPTPAALADYLASTRGTISQTLIALESKGHVTCEVGQRDRRSIDLALIG